MKLRLYSQLKHVHLLKAYSLNDVTHTDSPQSIISKTQSDNERYSVVITDNDESNIIGFFCLHIGSGPEEYGFYQKGYALVRGFSIDDRYKNQGYGSKALNDIFDFMDSNLDLKIDNVILAVNENNIFAQKAYKKSGFTVIKNNIEGKLGKLLIMEKSRA
ncbi:GNAT family N-acetyltransferase [Actinomyces sp. zg-332]|uniref:GNAT family N-acetyltransferase n=1 Tax=Actinomyces sp. zg-332 TaxID=2708340 RepID=UPI00141D758C|nr:GNAT family N-acetyltransferase [Actinomyces sp. zg-332]QPK94684.1 GNAT family N-acetyltransferase [Actinomyces sp. zg-332]